MYVSGLFFKWDEAPVLIHKTHKKYFPGIMLPTFPETILSIVFSQEVMPVDKD